MSSYNISTIRQMSKSITPSKKSISPYKPSSSNKKSASPIKNSIENNPIQLKLRKNREKLGHTLDTYTLLIRSKNPIRCLEHNSAISVYCEKDNRLLCSNCIFGKNQHRFHKVSPLDKSFENINLDLRKMKQLIFKEVQAIHNVSDVVVKNLQYQQLDFGQALNEMSLKIEECHVKLDQFFMNSKFKLSKLMESLRLKHQTVAIQLNFLKDMYSVNQMMSLINRNDINDDDKLVYEHVVCQTLLNQKKFQGNVWNNPKSQMKRAGAEEVAKISSFCDILTSFIQIQALQS